MVIEEDWWIGEATLLSPTLCYKSQTSWRVHVVGVDDFREERCCFWGVYLDIISRAVREAKLHDEAVGASVNSEVL